MQEDGPGLEAFATRVRASAGSGRDVVSVRLGRCVVERIEALARQVGEARSDVIRCLLEAGLESVEGGEG